MIYLGLSSQEEPEFKIFKFIDIEATLAYMKEYAYLYGEEFRYLTNKYHNDNFGYIDYDKFKGFYIDKDLLLNIDQNNLDTVRYSNEFKKLKRNINIEKLLYE